MSLWLLSLGRVVGNMSPLSYLVGDSFDLNPELWNLFPWEILIYPSPRTN